MEERQSKFLECIRKRTTEENRPLMETVAKVYAINEGLVDIGYIDIIIGRVSLFLFLLCRRDNRILHLGRQ